MTETARFYRCPHCHRTSHNVNDVRERYCGFCHRWAGREAYWAYRVVRHRDGMVGMVEVDEWYAIHEVHYSPDDVPVNCAVEPSPVLSTDAEGIRWTLDAMRVALAQPVLDYEEIGKESA